MATRRRFVDTVQVLFGTLAAMGVVAAAIAVASILLAE